MPAEQRRETLRKLVAKEANSYQEWNLKNRFATGQARNDQRLNQRLKQASALYAVDELKQHWPDGLESPTTFALAAAIGSMCDKLGEQIKDRAGAEIDKPPTPLQPFPGTGLASKRLAETKTGSTPNSKRHKPRSELITIEDEPDQVPRMYVPAETRLVV